MKEIVLVSACLLGDNCKYNGKNNYNEKVMKYLEDKTYIKICPETMGKLKIPRVPSEIEAGFDGDDVVNGKAKVYSKEDEDVTAQFLVGAEKALEIAFVNNCKKAILKESSPSCGSTMIYDGNFSSTKKSGHGVCAALLIKNGIDVISEESL